MIYFTSDLHFYHKNIIKYSPAFRDYENAEEMNEKLIEIWNSVVTPEDTVYNLGDLSMAANTKKVIEVAKRLNGKHFLILGNHDYPIKSEKEKLMEMIKDDGNKLFEDIRDYKFLTFPGVQIALSHYPMAGWENMQQGSIMLHGHLHDYISEVKGKILNVGFDLHGKLLSLDEVLSFVKDLPTLPYRREDNERMVAIKASSDTAIRKKMIADELKRINSTYDMLDNLTAEKLASFKTLANLVASEIEHLHFKKKKGDKKKKLRSKSQYWTKSRIQEMVKNKAHSMGIRFSRVNARNTSALAFDGSGYVRRNTKGDIATFTTGKIYHADLNASYNIAARYFLRELERAKVPVRIDRTSQTLDTLINLAMMPHHPSKVA